MSRKIMPKPSVTITEEEILARRTEEGKLLFTSYQGRNCALLIQNNRLVEASFFQKEAGGIGAIYIGKVKNVVKTIDACFVETAKGELCFLPLKNAASPFLLNRKPDGRILEGDELLVQVVRDAQKAKRASVTAQISLANEYFAFILGSAKVGYSAKLSGRKKENVRKYLREKSILSQQDGGNDRLASDYGALLPAGVPEQLKSEGILLEMLNFPQTGIVIRTMAGELESAEELLKNFYDLSEQYIRLLYIAMHRNCFSCIRKAENIYDSVLRQFPLDSMESLEIVTDQEEVFAQLTGNADSAGKDNTGEDGSAKDQRTRNGIRIRFYQDTFLSLSGLYSLDSKLETAFESRVWLKSGGYLIIEPTEALTVIDVNSGKYESGKNAEDTYRKINMEAAEEVAHQIRLRNLSGIIIVDFINMHLPEDNRELLLYLRELTAKDKVPTKVVDMTALGLVEITRKKINKPLKEQFLAGI